MLISEPILVTFCPLRDGESRMIGTLLRCLIEAGFGDGDWGSKKTRVASASGARLFNGGVLRRVSTLSD